MIGRIFKVLPILYLSRYIKGKQHDLQTIVLVTSIEKIYPMKKIVFLSIVYLIASCTEEKSSEAEQITEYYQGFEHSDYKKIKGTLADSLTITEGDYTMAFTPESYYEHFKWDSVFKPVYDVVAIENQEDKPVATVSVYSLRFEFLKNNPLTCRHRFHFDSGKITKIENLDCIDTNWEIWQEERDALVSWVKLNHPELDGFIQDLSRKGAVNYVKAIELYKNRQAN